MLSSSVLMMRNTVRVAAAPWNRLRPHRLGSNQVTSSIVRLWSALSRPQSTTLGILRETYDMWERRTPLCPSHVEHLLKLPERPVKDVIVQPCSSRVFSDSEYKMAGATVQEDLSQADLILGVKRPHTLYPNKAYMFFSHVIKGQLENMPLLQHVLDDKIQLFDYECIMETASENKQRRLVAFGKFAGRAGMTDAFNPLGRRLLALGFSTPFLHCPPAHMHEDWNAVKHSVTHLGDCISKEGLGAEPVIFCFTGKGGNVHGGAMEVFDLLPHEMITMDDLTSVRSKTGPQKCVYGLSLEPRAVFQRRDGKDFDLDDYYRHPHEYESTFHERVAPHINVLVNGMYWDDRYPRLLTKKQMQHLYQNNNKRLMLVVDISCDVNGSIEFLERTTCVDRPYFQYDPIVMSEVSESISSDGVTMMGVDILPTELPRESSEYFGDALLPVLEKFVSSEEGKTISERVAPTELMNACIALGGSLTPRFRHLESFLKRPSGRVHPKELNMVLWIEGHLFDSGFINHALDIIEQNDSTFEIVECHVRRKLDGIARKSNVIIRVGAENEASFARIENQISSLMDLMENAECSMKRLDQDVSTGKPSTATVVDLSKERRILVLGSGLVSKSLVGYLGRDESRVVTVVGAEEGEARAVSKAAKNGRHAALNVHHEMNRIGQLIEDSDIVVSLLPATMHASIANACIEHTTDLVTASYESEAMRQLNERATAYGVRILNEVGLDPGLDHMSAKRIIDDIHARGGVVTGLSSVCGGLPSPEAADNPLMYKFSWSPLSVLAACQNDALYRVKDGMVKVNGKRLLRAAAPFEDVWPALRLECLPNRDALVYEEKYDIPHAAELFRGTLRYRGFSELMGVFQSMGLLDEGDADGMVWSDVIHRLQCRAGAFRTLDDFLLYSSGGNRNAAERAADCLDYLGMSGNTPVAYPDNIAASFCEVLKHHCRYEENERDMVLMHTSVQAIFADGAKEEHLSSMQAYGDSDLSAMSKTVGYTAAASTELLLDKDKNGSGGLLLPTSKEIYLPILEALEKEGVKFKEEVRCNDGFHQQISV